MEISFEFFPPKSPKGKQKLLDTVKQLSNVQPAYFSVTYGAGGSTQDRTVDAISELANTGVTIAPHISCICSTKTKTRELLDLYKYKNISNLVTIRGDVPQGMCTADGDFHYSIDLIKFIREHSGNHFNLKVAAYPEFHPQANCCFQDLKHFKAKIDAGANSAITQYFFNADAYFRFMDECQKLNINVPIVPGIMPITNYKQLANFSDGCGAEIPRWLRSRLASLSDDLDAIYEFGVDVVTKLCEKLLTGGAPGLHFYTLNKACASLDILNNLNLANESTIKAA